MVHPEPEETGGDREEQTPPAASVKAAKAPVRRGRKPKAKSRSKAK
ncbi:MAG: hypothetical protein ACRC5A_12385 [Enterobacteriaceae bacterium]